jgi:hypothetical protein
MKKSKLVVVLLAVCAMAGIASANLLSNGNFNLPDSSAAPESWNIWTYGGGWANHQNDASSYDSTWYMAVGGSSSAGAGLYQVVAGTAGVTYTLTVDGGAQAWWKPKGEMKIFFLDASDAVLDTQVAVTADPQGYDILVPWHNVSLTAVAPVGTTQVKVEFACASGEGTVWFDNAVLIPEPATLAVLGLGGLLLRRKK